MFIISKRKYNFSTFKKYIHNKQVDYVTLKPGIWNYIKKNLQFRTTFMCKIMKLRLDNNKLFNDNKNIYLFKFLLL